VKSHCARAKPAARGAAHGGPCRASSGPDPGGSAHRLRQIEAPVAARGDRSSSALRSGPSGRGRQEESRVVDGVAPTGPHAGAGSGRDGEWSRDDALAPAPVRDGGSWKRLVSSSTW
jgi:hypothetical protein